MVLTPGKSDDAALAEMVSEYYADPVGFVLAVWAWGREGRLKHFTGPDPWQFEFLEWLGEQVRVRQFDGHTAVLPIRRSVSSGHGIGKSTLSAWLILWIMCTRPYCKVVVTSATEVQLSTKLWAAVNQWYHLSPLLLRWFDINTERLFHRNHKQEWFCIPQTCKEENAQAFAGQHAIDSTSAYVFDEASEVPDKVWEVAEGGLTDGEPMFFVFGNMTESSGPFNERCFGKLRQRWHPMLVDSRESSFSNKALIKEWIEDFGEESDFVRVRVRGLPPLTSTIQFIDEPRIKAAQDRQIHLMSDDPMLCGLDMSRGGQDATVFRFRAGLDARSVPPIELQGGLTRDTTHIVDIALRVLTERWNGRVVEMLFIDSSGAGGAVYDRLVQLGHQRRVAEVSFGSESPLRRYANMRAFMWGQCREWLPRAGIDSSQKLVDDLKGPQYHHNNRDRIVLEGKKEMKMRGLSSPDHADALCLTFAQPVVAKLRQAERRRRLPRTRRGSKAVDTLDWMT